MHRPHLPPTPRLPFRFSCVRVGTATPTYVSAGYTLYRLPEVAVPTTDSASWYQNLCSDYGLVPVTCGADAPSVRDGNLDHHQAVLRHGALPLPFDDFGCNVGLEIERERGWSGTVSFEQRNFGSGRNITLSADGKHAGAGKYVYPLCALGPTLQPTAAPTTQPTTADPTVSPTISPATITPTVVPTTTTPTIGPTTAKPTTAPSGQPTPSASPTAAPITSAPTKMPTASPTTHWQEMCEPRTEDEVAVIDRSVDAFFADDASVQQLQESLNRTMASSAASAGAGFPEGKFVGYHIRGASPARRRQSSVSPPLYLKRTRWAFGQTYRLPALNLHFGVSFAFTYELDPNPPGFFINAGTGEVVVIPPAGDGPAPVGQAQPGNVSLRIVPGGAGLQPIVLGDFAFTYQFEDRDARSAATGPGGVDCPGGGGDRVEASPVDGVGEFDLMFACSSSLEQPLAFALDDGTPNVGYTPYTVVTDAASGDTRLGVTRTTWSTTATYHLPPFTVTGLSHTGLSHSIGMLDAAGDRTLNLEPLPPGFFMHTGTGEIIGTYGGDAANATNAASGAGVYTSDLVAYAPGIRTVVGSVDFLFMHEDVDARSGATSPGGLADCLNNGTRIETALGSGNIRPFQFDGTFACLCTGGFAGADCDVPQAQASVASSSDEVKTTVIVVFAAVLLLIVAFFAARRAKRIKLQQRRTAVIRRLAKGADPANAAVLDEAIFEALDMHLDSVVPALLARGATASARRPSTQSLPHSIVLARPTADEGLLLVLMRSHCEIDRLLGAEMQDPAKFAAVLKVFCTLAAECWRGKTDGATCAHRVVDAAMLRSISMAQAVVLVRALLGHDAEVIAVTDANGRTAGDLATASDHCIELQRLLTVVVYGVFQLTEPSKVLHRSATALVMDCRDMRPSEDDNDNDTDDDDDEGGEGAARRELAGRRLVLKMMSDEASWMRELESRSGLSELHGIVQVLSAVTPDGRVGPLVGRIPVIRHAGAGTPARRSLTLAPLAAELQSKYPYALAMDKADRNLLEIIGNERLAAEPLGAILVIARKLGDALHELHTHGIVHGDVKYRTPNSPPHPNPQPETPTRNSNPNPNPQPETHSDASERSFAFTYLGNCLGLLPQFPLISSNFLLQAPQHR